MVGRAVALRRWLAVTLGAVILVGLAAPAAAVSAQPTYSYDGARQLSAAAYPWAPIKPFANPAGSRPSYVALAQPRSETAIGLAAEGSTDLTPAVIGEGMSSRVIPYAEEHGYTYYEGLSNPENYSQDELLAHNRAQIQEWMQEGRPVVDVGPDPLRAGYPGPTSPNYSMELQELEGYGNYSQVQLDELERFLVSTAH